MPSIGDIRIVKADSYNYAVEEYKTIVAKETKEERKDWVIKGYYGHRIENAIKFAMLHGFKDGPITLEAIRELESKIKVKS